MEEIRSVKNQKVKDARKLHQRKYRKSAQAYLLEGFHLVEEAAKSQADILEVFVTAEGAEKAALLLTELPNSKVYLVTEEILKGISEERTPQGIVAIVKMANVKLADDQGKWLLLDGVQDPGNVGTLIRTADGAGFTGVVLGEGSADLYSDKVLRSAQGSHFHLAVYQEDLASFLATYQKTGYPIYGTALRGDTCSYRDVRGGENFALMLGNEGQGIQANFLQQTTCNLFIPIKGAAESLNVAVAGGILMFALSD